MKGICEHCIHQWPDRSDCDRNEPVKWMTKVTGCIGYQKIPLLKPLKRTANLVIVPCECEKPVIFTLASVIGRDVFRFFCPWCEHVAVARRKGGEKREYVATRVDR